MLFRSVNGGMAEYPDVELFSNYLAQQCREVVFINKFPDDIDPVLYNIFLLGRAIRMKGFPFSADKVEAAINTVVTGYYKAKSLKAFNIGIEYELIM